jgi:catechol 2,3-dioxygenase-like lactoylglutathione lyase family enzyme
VAVGGAPGAGLGSGALSFLENGIDQIAFVVEDLEAIVERYWRTFGIGGWVFHTYAAPLLSYMTYHGRPAEYSMRLALSYFGPNRVELIQPLEGPSVYHDFVEKHGYGVQHFGIVVPQMESALSEARAAGIKVLMEGAGFGLDGDGYFAYLDTEDAFGVTYELIERPARRVEPDKTYPE